MPDPTSLDYMPSMSMLAHQDFLERARPMDEDCFLHFEEVDWQLRPGNLLFGLLAGALVFHRNGASIGSVGIGLRTHPL